MPDAPPNLIPDPYPPSVIHNLLGILVWVSLGFCLMAAVLESSLENPSYPVYMLAIILVIIAIAAVNHYRKHHRPARIVSNISLLVAGAAFCYAALIDPPTLFGYDITPFIVYEASGLTFVITGVARWIVRRRFNKRLNESKDGWQG